MIFNRKQLRSLSTREKRMELMYNAPVSFLFYYNLLYNGLFKIMMQIRIDSKNNIGTSLGVDYKRDLLSRVIESNLYSAVLDNRISSIYLTPEGMKEALSRWDDKALSIMISDDKIKVESNKVDSIVDFMFSGMSEKEIDEIGKIEKAYDTKPTSKSEPTYKSEPKPTPKEKPKPTPKEKPRFSIIPDETTDYTKYKVHELKTIAKDYYIFTRAKKKADMCKEVEEAMKSRSRPEPVHLTDKQLKKQKDIDHLCLYTKGLRSSISIKDIIIAKRWGEDAVKVMLNRLLKPVLYMYVVSSDIKGIRSGDLKTSMVDSLTDVIMNTDEKLL